MDWNAIIELDKQLLLVLNGSDSLFIDGLAKTLTAATLWIPLYISLFYLVLKNSDSFMKVLLVLAGAGLCVLIAGSLDDMIVKPMVARWRPTHDNEIGMIVDVVNGYRGGRYGFFSAHASNTFSIAIFFSLLIRSRLLTVSLITWSLVNCWTRMYLGVHYPGDILCGLLWGGIVGVGVWLLYRQIYKRLFASKVFVSTYYTTTGYQLVDVDVVISVLVFTLIYAIMRACFYLYA
ncbi:MAG: phosphatase PAP2 family protein [Prevotella sp.]|nr:phosphatase PAP2 family protein [Prevotella sp.]MDE6011812.1 phosphatase PAP2 family protein [Prevotella sp.]